MQVLWLLVVCLAATAFSHKDKKKKEKKTTIKKIRKMPVIAGPACQMLWEEECWDEPKNKCSLVAVPVARTQLQPACRVVNQRRCAPTSERRCSSSPVRLCSTTSTLVTETQPRQVCSQVHEKKCSQVRLIGKTILRIRICFQQIRIQPKIWIRFWIQIFLPHARNK